VADIIDLANERADEQLDDALAAHRRGLVDPAAAEFDGIHCVECDEPVHPPARAALGHIRCLGCQEDRERRG